VVAGLPDFKLKVLVLDVWKIVKKKGERRVSRGCGVADRNLIGSYEVKRSRSVVSLAVN
jgi:hypothetical protein